MSTTLQDLHFTRYVYQNTFISNKHRNTFCNPQKMLPGDFDQFILSNTIYPFGLAIKKANRLSLRIALEPFKNVNSKSQGIVLYLSNEVPNNQDETGLRPTKYANTYYGDFYKFNDHNIKIKDLVLCQAIPPTKQLIIDVYYGYYPKTSYERIQVIDGHLWHKKNHP